MCWSYEVSVMAGSFSYLIALYLWLRNIDEDRWLSIVIFTFSTIQWCDAILWKNLNNDNVNSVITSLVPLIFALEPLSVILGAKYVGYDVSNLEIVIYIIYACIIYSTKSAYTETILSQNQSLVYGPDPQFLSALSFLCFGLYPLIKYYPHSLSKLLFITILIGGWTYSYLKTDSFTSNWCLYSNLVSVVALMTPYIS